ncbi:MAG: tetratricopeptide repeat protein [Planctomycetota bacterium]
MAEPPPPAHDFHEQTTELQEFKEKALDFWARYGTWITVLAVAGALLFSGTRLWSVWNTNQRNEAADALAAAGNFPNSYRLIAEEQEGPPAWIARLHAGDLRLAEHRAGKPTDGLTLDQTLDRAAEHYQAIVNEQAPPLFQANAHIGLAVVAESRQDWAGAKAAWARAAEVAAPAGLALLAAQANDRLARVDAYANPTPYPDVPEGDPAADADRGLFDDLPPSTPPATQPAEGAATADPEGE